MVKVFRTSRFLLAPLFSVLSSVFMTGCSKDNDVGLIYSVPLEYQTFVDTFLYEAALRGYSIEIKSLIINFDATLEEPHCAKCNSRSLNKRVQKIISINPNIQCWFTEE